VVERRSRRSVTGELLCPTLDMQLMGDHLCGKPSATRSAN